MVTLVEAWEWFREFLTGAGPREWGFIVGAVVALILFFYVITWYMFKYQSDFLTWAKLALLGLLVGIVVFLFFFWLEFNEYAPLLDLFT